jgi:hypothetical protein
MGDGPGIYRPLLLSKRGRPSRFQENPSAVPPGNMFRKGVRLGGCPKNSDEARIPRSSGNDNDTLYQVKAKNARSHACRRIPRCGVLWYDIHQLKKLVLRARLPTGISHGGGPSGFVRKQASLPCSARRWIRMLMQPSSAVYGGGGFLYAVHNHIEEEWK